MQVFWHRRDLRAHDNVGLAVAADDDAVVPTFVLDEDVLVHASAVRVAFLLDALSALREWYRDRGSGLIVRQGGPTDVLPAVVEEFEADGVVWNHDYTGLARERDDRVRAALRDAGISHEAFHDAVHHEPGAIRTNAGDPYSVFASYWKKWRDREKAGPEPAPATDSLASVSDDPLPALAALGFEEPDATVPAAGHEAARKRIEAFCDDAIYRYAEGREYPARGETSGVSQDLSFGTLGVRELFTLTEDAMADATDQDAEEGVTEYQRQLAFREFYVQALYFNPETVTENYDEYENPIEWHNDSGEIRAWKRGETGYPLVDAGMRQLREEAFVHNRVRMVVASFLTKDLLADWRVGYEYFREHLVDHDTANDVGGWQWAASTGTDAQPYFRVFNPMTQQADYDPDAEYVKTYVPELRDVPVPKIHSWHELSEGERAELAPEYPAPIVDHGERREDAIAMFETARGKD